METKTSGEKQVYASGYQRDTSKGKVRYDLVPLGPLKRLAELYTRGAELYGDRNWELASGEEEMSRFRASAWRHFIQFMNDEYDEDHAAAAVWNLFAIMHHQGEQIDKGLGY